MSNERLRDKIIYWITSHPWLKLIALILAIMIWFYVKGETSTLDY